MEHSQSYAVNPSRNEAPENRVHDTTKDMNEKKSEAQEECPELKETHTVKSSTCKSIMEERPKIELPSHRINGKIQFMGDHTLIGKFIGFWPTEKALQGWIAAKWKPKGHTTLQLGPKGFFTVIFIYLEDRNRVLDEGPYFFN